MLSNKSTETRQNTFVHLSPAKINLFLAVCNFRSDGFHELLSLVTPLAWGDEIRILFGSAQSEDSLSVHGNWDVPADGSNLALRALKAFREKVAFEQHVHIDLFKNIPPGAGLGGGSSNAATVLKALNKFLKRPLTIHQLYELGATLGSDVPLFMDVRPQKMWGRGEFLTPVPESIHRKISGTRLLLFKPAFEIKTPWAYQKLKENPQHNYCAHARAEALYEAFCGSLDTAHPGFFNSFEPIVFDKFLAYAPLLAEIKERFDLSCLLSGSGSACFAWLRPDSDVNELRRCIQCVWGQDAFVVETTIL